MVKKAILLAAFVVAVLCGSAPPAEALGTWMAYWGVQRWHHHYHAQAGTVGWDYASSGFGHHGWGSRPAHWGAVIALSARPYPPAVDWLVARHLHDKRDFHHWRGYWGGYGYGHGFRHGYGYGPGWGHGAAPLGTVVY